jgi:hypothetical protein
MTSKHLREYCREILAHAYSSTAKEKTLARIIISAIDLDMQKMNEELGCTDNVWMNGTNAGQGVVLDTMTETLREEL